MEAGSLKGAASRVVVSVRRNTLVLNSDGSPGVDQLHREELGQKEYYFEVVYPFVERCIQGCCGSIITYGGWGSGKSYTLGTLDPQQLVAASSGDESAGVLPRCLRQLYERLGSGVAVEITCVEVQGEEVADLLDPRVESAAGRLTPEGAGAVVGGLAASSSGACPTTSPSPLTPRAPARSPRPAAAAAVTAARRKPLTLAVARSLPEALLTLQRAVSCRQAFVTASRHSSSRTHAVFQLRWRNPGAASAVTAAQAAGDPSSASGDAAPAARGRAAGAFAGPSRRPFSAPPRGGLPGPAASSAQSAGQTAGPVCTLTLVDTCSSCPLLPPKEGSAVKRSLLALGRVLSALQRRQALMLRESKLTRLLEGALDQVLLVACLGGSSDEAALQLVKLLQQGAQRDGAQRRTRRASSSDSSAQPVAWESTVALTATPSSRARVSLNPRGSLGGVPGPCRPASAASAAGGACPPLSPAGPLARRSHPLPAMRASQPAGAVVGPSPRTPAKPATAALPNPAAAASAARRAAPSGTCGDGGVLPCSAASPVSASCVAGTTAGRTRPPPLLVPRPSGPGAAPPPATSPPLPSPAASAAGVGEATGGGTAPAGASTFARQPEPGPVPAHSAAAHSVASLSPTAAITATATTTTSMESPKGGAGLATTPRGRASGSWSVGSVTRTSSGSLGAGTGALTSPRQRPAALTARAAPGPDVRRSQGFSVLAGKWAPPPPLNTRRLDRSFPILPVTLSPVGAPPPARSPPEPGTAPASAPLTVRSCQPPPAAAATHAPPQGGNDGSAPSPRAPPPAAARGVAAPAQSSPGVSPSPHTTPRGAPVAMATASTPPAAAGAALAHSGTAGASACSSPASGSLSQRRRSGIPAPPPPPARGQATSSPFLSLALASAAAASLSAVSPAAAGAGRRARSPLPPSPAASSPATMSPLVSVVAALHPTPRASMRYSSTNVSHDAAAASAARTRMGAAPVASAAGQGLAARSSTPDARLQGATPAAPAGVPAGLGAVTELAPVGGGARWPSPMLRVRRAEWLAEGRSRSALPRPRPVAALGAEARRSLARAASAKTPRERVGGGAAALGRVTLSAQYKDLEHVFKAFQDSFRHRTPLHQRSAAPDIAHGAPPLSLAAQPPLQAPPQLHHEQPLAPLASSASTAVASACAAGRSKPRLLILPTSARVSGASLGSPAPSLISDNRQLTPSPGRYQQPGAAGPSAASAAAAAAPFLPGHGSLAAATVAADASPHRSFNLGRAQSAAAPAATAAASNALGASAIAVSSLARPPPMRHRSPAAPEDGLLSLTAAAAAAAAASPRPPAAAGQLLPGRQRPGVSRGSGAQPSPSRQRRSAPFPDHSAAASTNVISSMVLELNRLPSATAIGNNPSPPRASGGGAAAGAGGAETLGPAGGPQQTATAAAAGAGSDPGVLQQLQVAADDEDCLCSLQSADSGLSNMLGPQSLADLHLMITAGGAAALVRASGAAGEVSGIFPSPCGGGGAAAAAAGSRSPAPAVAPADGTGAAAAADDAELPAFSCFVIPHYALAASSSAGAAQPAPSGNAGDGGGGDAQAAAGALPQQAPAAAAPTSHFTVQAPEACGSPTPPEPPSEAPSTADAAPQHNERPCAKQSPAAAAQGQVPQRPLLVLGAPERASAESGVLRGSCTQSVADDLSPRASAASDAQLPLLQHSQPAAQQGRSDVTPRAAATHEHRHRLARRSDVGLECSDAAAAVAVEMGSAASPETGSGSSSAATAAERQAGGREQPPEQPRGEKRSGEVRAGDAKRRAFNGIPGAPCTSPSERAPPPSPGCTTPPPLPSLPLPAQQQQQQQQPRPPYDIDEQSVVLGDSDSDTEGLPGPRRTRTPAASAGGAAPPPTARLSAAVAGRPAAVGPLALMQGRASVRERVAAFEAALSAPPTQRGGGEWISRSHRISSLGLGLGTVTGPDAEPGQPASATASASARAVKAVDQAEDASGGGDDGGRSSLARAAEVEAEAAAEAAEFPEPEPSEEPDLRGRMTPGRAPDGGGRAAAPATVRQRAAAVAAREAKAAGCGGAASPAAQRTPPQPQRGVSATYAAAAAAAAARAAAATPSPSPSARPYGFGRLGAATATTAAAAPKGQPSPVRAGKLVSPFSGGRHGAAGERTAVQASPRTLPAPATATIPAGTSPPPKGSYATLAAQRLARGGPGSPAAAGTAVAVPAGSPAPRAVVSPAAGAGMASRQPGGDSAGGSATGTPSARATPPPQARYLSRKDITASPKPAGRAVGGAGTPATPGGSAPAAPATGEDEEGGLGLRRVPPPPAYPAGFVSWAKKVFAGGVPAAALPKPAGR